MKDDFTTEELDLIELAREYSDADKARELLEHLRWPNGPICPHCRNDGKAKAIYPLKAKATSKSPARKGVYKCGACRKQFTVTVNTIFESSHIPIATWLMAVFLLCSSKKSISSLQLSRMLKVSYKTAWFLSHRIRHAMADDASDGKLSGEVEIDETFIGGKGELRTKAKRKTPVVALIQRGGHMKTAVVTDVGFRALGNVIKASVEKTAVVSTDEHSAYVVPLKEYAKHYTVNHTQKEYSVKMPDGVLASVNHCESFFSLLKRGFHGAWHHVSREHLPRYSSEFAFRWNHRKVTDGERMAIAIDRVDGKRLTFRQCV